MVGKFKSLLKCSRLGGESGQSVIEVILSSVVIGSALLAGMVLLQNVSAHSVQDDQRTMALHMANDKMESILADEVFYGYDYITENNFPQESAFADIEGVSRWIVITEVSYDDFSVPEQNSGLKKVDIYVEWGSSQNRESVVLNTLVSE